jgi:hypothetical protein
VGVILDPRYSGKNIVFKNRLLKRIFGHEEEIVSEGWGK